MHLPVLIEPVPGTGFRAIIGEPFAVTGIGYTPDAAIENLKSLVNDRISSNAHLVSIEIEMTDHPWAIFVKSLRENPSYFEWQRAIENVRQTLVEKPELSADEQPESS